MKRRLFLGAGLAASLTPAAVRAQAWPARPIRLVLGYAPGGSADVTAREVTTPLAKLLGQPIVVDYKAGASGTIAAAEVARSAPDGYTLGLLDNAPLTIVPALRNPGYNPLAQFTHVAMVSSIPQLLVAPASLPAGNVRELVALLKNQPGRLNYASGGAGSVGHLAAELFKQRTGTFAVHVPFRGAGPAVTALMAGDVQFAFLTPTSTKPFIDSGKLKALGVGSRTRLDILPRVPTIAESGLPGYEAPGWFALAGPAGLPEAVSTALRNALATTLSSPSLAGRLEALGQVPAASGGNVRAGIAAELATWKKLIAERQITIEA